MRRSSPLKRSTKPLKRSSLKRAGFRQPGDSARANGVNVPKRASITPASNAQREKVRWLSCCVCGANDPDPAHLIARSVTSIDQEDALAVIPLCREHHTAFDTGILDALPYLEPRFREELAFAVKRVGLVSTLRRVTNDRLQGERY